MSDELNEKEQTVYSPFAAPVLERQYTKDMVKAQIGENPVGHVEQPIPEAVYNKPIDLGDDDDDDLPTASSTKPSPEPKEPLNGGLQDMPDGEKRKAARKTADTIIETYARFAPAPFKHISKFDMSKMKQLDLNGEISLKMIVTEDDLTVNEYMDGFNESVDKTFEITDAMKEEIKDPLVDLLMEQGLALTPTQRLLMVVGGHFIQMGVAATQLYMAKKESLVSFKEFRVEQVAKNRGAIYSAPQPPAPNQNAYAPIQDTPSPTPPPPPPMEDDFITPISEEIYEKPPVSEEYAKPDVTIENYINDDSITIEEE